MSILNKFSFKSTPKVEKELMDLTDLELEIELEATAKRGSIPNRILSLALSAGAAYSVGLHPCYIAFVAYFAILLMFLLPATPRPIFELGVAVNLLLIAAGTLPPEAVTALEFLIVFKLFLELICLGFDRLAQLYAKVTEDQKHSYYLFLTLAIFMAKVAAVSAIPFFNGFVDGFQAGISGM